MEKLETHYYDNMEIRELDVLKLFYKGESVDRARDYLINVIKDPTSVSMINLIADGASEKSAHMLLCLIAKHIQKTGIVEDYVLEQFKDISGGPCIEGRSMRMLQIAKVMYDL